MRFSIQSPRQTAKWQKSVAEERQKLRAKNTSSGQGKTSNVTAEKMAKALLRELQAEHGAGCAVLYGAHPSPLPVGRPIPLVCVRDSDWKRNVAFCTATDDGAMELVTGAATWLQSGPMASLGEFDAEYAAYNAFLDAAVNDSSGKTEQPDADPPLPVTAAPTGPASGARSAIYDDIQKLGELRDAGLLTDDEFATEKTRLLRDS